jgi:hypothetical protein
MSIFILTLQYIKILNFTEKIVSLEIQIITAQQFWAISSVIKNCVGKKCIFFSVSLSLQLLFETFFVLIYIYRLSLETSAKSRVVHVNCPFCCPILTHTGICWQILVKAANIKFHESTFNSSQVVTERVNGRIIATCRCDIFKSPSKCTEQETSTLIL